MAYQSTNLGVAIEGLAGLGGTVQLRGTAICTGPPSAAALYDYEWLPQLAEIPRSIASSIDPFVGDYNLSAFQFSLQATDALLGALVPVQRKTGTTIVNAISAPDSIVDVTPTGALSVGDVVYIGDETVWISGAIAIGPTFDRFIIQRGIGWTVARDYPAGEGIYSQLPYLRGRVVRLVRMIDEAAAEIIWSGVVRNLALNDQQTEIIIDAAELIGTLQGATGNTAPRVYTPSIGSVTTNNDSTAILGSLPVSPQNIRLCPANSTAYIQATVGDNNYILRGVYWPLSPGQVVFGEVVQTGPNSYDVTAESPVAYPPNGPVIINDDTAASAFPSDSTFQEVIFFSRDAVPDGAGSRGTLDNTIPDPRHPLSIALAFLVSSGGDGYNNPEDPDSLGSYLAYDVLAADVGMGIPTGLVSESRVDIASFRNLIAIDNDIEIDQFLVCQDAETFDVLEVVRDRLLAPYQYFLAIDQAGRIAARKLSSFGVNAIAQVEAGADNSILIPDKVALDFKLATTVSRLTANVGGWLFDEGQGITTTTTGSTRLDQLMTGGRGDSYDYSTIAVDRYPQALAKLANLARLRAEHPPVLRCRMYWTHDETIGGFTGGAIPSIGEWVRIFAGGEAELKLVGPSGARVDPDDADNWIAFVGLVVGVTQNFADYTQDVSCLLVGWQAGNFVRLIAPAGETIDFGFTAGEYYFDLDGFDILGAGFAVGDDVAVYYLQGMQWEDSSPRDITAITAPAPGVIRIFLGAVAYDTTPPLAGMIIRLANVNAFSNPSWTTGALVPPAFASRRYCYNADEAGEVFLGQAGDVFGL